MRIDARTLGKLALLAVLVAAPALAQDKAPAAPAATAPAGEAAPAGKPMTAEEMVSVLKVLDDRQRNSGDYKALVYLEQAERGKTDTVREALVYRRDSDEKLMILFSKPKAEEGKGYLRENKNLWSYDPNVGKWDRTTERERIAGTDSRRADFDQSTLARDYSPEFQGDSKLGQFHVRKLKLLAKQGIDVDYPVKVLYVDDNGNALKRQDFALSGKLMRTGYWPKWKKLFSESKKGDFWYSEEIRFYDEVEKGNSTILLIKTVDLRPLQANIFTKAWMESKSR